MKKFSAKTLIAIIIGSLLFFVLGRFVTVPSPVYDTSINIQYGVLAFLSCVYGPVAGALTGLIGHFLIDYASGVIWWSWIVASAVFGLLLGIGAKKLHFSKDDLGKYGLVKFNTVQIFAHVISWLLIAMVLDLWWYSEPLPMVIAQGFSAVISNSITTAAIGSLLCIAYASLKEKMDAARSE